MTDPSTGWFEVAEIKTKRADFVTNTFKQVWLTRYPLPARIIYDRGGEFLGREFTDLIRHEYDIIAKSISKSNPQSNANAGTYPPDLWGYGKNTRSCVHRRG